MKICPDCQTRFDGNEAFCPNDGQKLIEAKELSPGALTGTTIGKTVKLERLTWSDEFGERYAGRMLESKAAVHVTVVNTGVEFADDAARRIEATRARVGSPLPPEINTLLRTELDHLPSFVIHTAPRGPSLRELLDEREKLDWETAARLTCRAARASEWLLEQGVVHWALHPGSVYVSRLAEGAVQLGEWYFDSLMGNRAPETRLNAGEPFPGYLDVMAPEIASGADADERSVVFALGALFFELVTGKAPFAAGSPEATLERLQAESAVKLSIAAGADGVHPELDDVIGMMLARNPEKRLQKPGAAAAVLSNILGGSPHEIAPPIERGDEAFDELYATTELSSFDRDSVPEPEDEDVDLSKKTLLMAGSAALEEKLAEDSAASDSGEQNEPISGGISGSSSTDDTDKDDPGADESTSSSASSASGVSVESTSAEDSNAEDPSVKDTFDAPVPGAPVVEDVENTDPIERPENKTLLMGSIGDEIRAAEAIAKADESGSSGISGESSTSHASSDGPEVAPTTGDEPSIETQPESEIETRELDREDAEPDTTSEAAEPTDDTDAKPGVEVDEIDPEDTQKLDLASSEKDRDDTPDDDAEAASADNENDDETEDEKEIAPSSASNDLQIGFVEAPAGSKSSGETDDWFSGTTDDAWERTLAEEHAQETEKRWKMVLSIALGAVVVAGLALIVYSQFIWEPESDEEPIAEEVAEETTADELEVDVERLVDRFDRAIEAGRISSPPGNSAYSALEELIEHAPDEQATLTATSQFVNAAVASAERAENDGDLRAARTILGHATTIAPKDSELRQKYQSVDERYRGTLSTLDGADAGTASTDAAEASDETAGGESVAVTDGSDQETSEKPDPTPKPKTRPDPKPQPRESVSDVLAKARQAYSRDDLRTAESLYKKAVGLSSNSHVANAGLGQVYFDQGAYARAVRYQMQAVRSKPNSVAYRINLGQSYYRLGKYSDAIRSWEAALERDPSNSNAKRYIELAQKKLD